MTKTFEEIFDEGFLGTKKRKTIDYEGPGLDRVPTFLDTSESVEMDLERRKQRAISIFLSEFSKTEEEREEAEQVNRENRKYLLWLKAHGMMD